MKTNTPSRVVCPVSELKDSGNCRQIHNQDLSIHLLSDSVFSEQQKLRLVLNWAQSFLSSSSSEFHQEFRGFHSLETADKEEKKLPDYRQSAAAKYNDHVFFNACGNEGLDSQLELSANDCSFKPPYSDHPYMLWPLCGETHEDISAEHQDASLASYGETYSIQKSEQQVELHQGDLKGETSTWRTLEKTSSLSHVKLPLTLSVYEQYQLCVDHLQHLRLREHVEPGNLINSPRGEGKTSEQTSKKPETLKHLEKVGNQTVTAAEKPPKEKSLTPDVEEVPGVKDTAAISMNSVCLCSGSLPRKNGYNPGLKRCRSGVEVQKKTAGNQGTAPGKCEKSNEILQRPQSLQAKRCMKRGTPEDKAKPTDYRYNHRTQTNTALCEDQKPASAAVAEWRCAQTEPWPADAAVTERWLYLPDEVWLSILSLLPLTDLCRVMQVNSRLYTLATDSTLWRSVRVLNSTLTKQWFLCVGRHRPRSLSLYSCSVSSRSSCGLETFFSLCGNFLEEVQVTSCTGPGPGLHGDKVLLLVGQLCDRVTSVDVSWSGATDKGVKGLTDCGPGLRLKSIILNGCKVNDDPLMKLIMRHKESLCRLEVFGCQFLSPSCLQTVCKMCPGLQYLNVGQVPKLTTDSLTVMTSQLKGLVSLNLTGLQAVTDDATDTLLQDCVKLQSLTLSSCPRVNDLTMNSISKYTPYIRSLDVSGCRAVTDAGVQSVALGCRRLQEIDLSSTSTGNRGVTLLADYCSRHLHTVKLSFCHISPEVVLKLCTGCKRLKMLHLYGCACLPSEGDIRRVNCNVKVQPLP